MIHADRILFNRIEAVKRALTDELTPGLVAAFSRLRSDELLLVYVGEVVDSGSDTHRSITLAELPTIDLASYDGPIIGLASVDLVRWDIPTKGIQFYRLDRLLCDRRRVDRLHRTWADLAEHLRRHHLDQEAQRRDHQPDQDRMRAEISAISTPAQLAKIPPNELVDIVAFDPEKGVQIRLSAGDSLDDLAQHPGHRFVAFDEVRPFIEGDESPTKYPIDLRTILRRSDLGGDLRQTITTLATAFHARWLTHQTRSDLERAYALALEVHLIDTDVDDLVAVLPDSNFESFLADGIGQYYYRQPLAPAQVHTAGAHHLHVAEILGRLAVVGPPVAFTLLPLRDLVESETDDRTRWADLGPVLRRCNRTETLARNAWLLVEDLLEADTSRRRRFRIDPVRLLETMRSCCDILSLTDPWRTRQGRREEWLTGTYETVREVLEKLVESSEGETRETYRALELWYRCGLADQNDIQALLEDLGAVLSSRPGRANRPDLSSDTESAGQTESSSPRDLGRAFLELLGGGGRAAAYPALMRTGDGSTPMVLDSMSDMSRSHLWLSQPFGARFGRYAETVDEIRRVAAERIPLKDKIARLEGRVDVLVRDRRLIFAPHHQARVLELLYDRSIDSTRELIERLRGGASVEVEVRTRSIEADSDESGIILFVTNPGNVEAQDIEVELVGSDDFELVGPSFKHTRATLRPNDSYTIRFAVKVVTEETLQMHCIVTWSDPKKDARRLPDEMRNRQQRSLQFSLFVDAADPGRFRKKSNPYMFGVPLEEHRQFFGRRQELDQLLAHLAMRRPQNMLLRGARRTGKTSLLNMVRNVLNDRERRDGVRSWFELSEAWDDALDNTVPVFLNLQGFDWTDGVPTATGFYQAVLDGLHDAGLATPTSERVLREPTVTATQFQRALRSVVDATDVRPVILMDEFDVLDRMAEKSDFYGPLRAAISLVQGVTWIVASALGLYEEVRLYESPLFNVFKILNLGVLDRKSAMELVLSPWEPMTPSPDETPLKFADDAVEAILSEAGYFPYFIQLLCSEIVDHVNQIGSNDVHYSTVLNVIDQAILGDRSAAVEHFRYPWDRAGTVGQLILLALLRHPGAMSHDDLFEAVERRLARSGDIPEGLAEQFDESMDRLLIVDAVARVPGSGYKIAVPIFERMLLKRDDREDLARTVDETMAVERTEVVPPRST